MGRVYPLGDQILLLNSTLKMTNTRDFNYDYDILIPAENINMDIQFLLNLILFFICIKNLFNVKKWCFEKQVKPYKLYCINSNALLVVICNFLILAKILRIFFLRQTYLPIRYNLLSRGGREFLLLSLCSF